MPVYCLWKLWHFVCFYLLKIEGSFQFWLLFFFFMESQDGWQWKASLEIILSSLSAQSHTNYSRFLRAVFRQVMIIYKNGDSATSLGSPCCCLSSLTVRRCCLMSKWNFLDFNLYPLLILFLWAKRHHFALSQQEGNLLYLPLSSWQVQRTLRCPFRTKAGFSRSD